MFRHFVTFDVLTFKILTFEILSFDVLSFDVLYVYLIFNGRQLFDEEKLDQYMDGTYWYGTVPSLLIEIT